MLTSFCEQLGIVGRVSYLRAGIKAAYYPQRRGKHGEDQLLREIVWQRALDVKSGDVGGA